MGINTNTASPSVPTAADQSAVPSGYQRTEVGLIPEEWDVKTIDELVHVDPENLPSSTPADYRFNYISLEQVDTGRLLSWTEERFDTAPSRARRVLRHDDVLMSTVRPNLMAHLHYASQIPNAVCSTGFAVLRSQPGRAIPSYIFAHLYAYGVNKQIEQTLAGSNYPAINGRDVKKIRIPCPPTTHEQSAIAEALSDVDRLIGALEKLIAKKRAIKQAAMQQLLTGKTRLPGFTEKWKARRLGDVLTFQVGCPFSSQFFNSDDRGLRLVRNGDLKGDDSPIHYSGPYEERFLISDGDVLVGMDGEFVPCRWQSGNALLNQRVGRIRGSNELDVNFAQYLLIQPLQEVQRATAGTTVKHLSHGDVAGIEIPLPRYKEQQAIGAALSDMDAEITSLEQRRDKTQQIKQGMMQQLLTGRVRLVKPKGAAAQC